jgi:hypothetical protein
MQLCGDGKGFPTLFRSPIALFAGRHHKTAGDDSHMEPTRPCAGVAVKSLIPEMAPMLKGLLGPLNAQRCADIVA